MWGGIPGPMALNAKTAMPTADPARPGQQRFHAHPLLATSTNIQIKYMPERIIVFQACRAMGSMPLLTHEERRKMLRDQQRAPTARGMKKPGPVRVVWPEEQDSREHSYSQGGQFTQRRAILLKAVGRKIARLARSGWGVMRILARTGLRVGGDQESVNGGRGRRTDAEDVSDIDSEEARSDSGCSGYSALAGAEDDNADEGHDGPDANIEADLLAGEERHDGREHYRELRQKAATRCLCVEQPNVEQAL